MLYIIAPENVDFPEWGDTEPVRYFTVEAGEGKITGSGPVIIWEAYLDKWLASPISRDRVFALTGQGEDPDKLIRAMEGNCVGYLRQPVCKEELERLRLRLEERERERRCREMDRALREEDFWLGVITRRFSADAAMISEAEGRGIDPRGGIQPVFVRYRAKQGVAKPDCRIEEQLREKFRRQYLAEFSGVQLLTIAPHKIVLLIFTRGVEHAYERLRRGCEEFLGECPELGLDGLCLMGDPAQLMNLANQVEKLVRVGTDQVYLDNQLLPSRQDKAQLEKPPQPNVEKYLALLDGRMYDLARAEMEKYLYTPAVMPKVNVNFLMNFRYQLMDGLRELRSVRKSGANIMRGISGDMVNSASDSVQDFLSLFDVVIHALRELDQLTSDHRNTVEEVKIHIQDHLTHEITRESLARRFYISADYLDRLFRREVGKTVTEYILECRVDRAKQLLENEELLISDVSYKAGFLNGSHFTRVFKKMVGMPPNAYRKAREQSVKPERPEVQKLSPATAPK